MGIAVAKAKRILPSKPKAKPKAKTFQKIENIPRAWERYRFGKCLPRKRVKRPIYARNVDVRPGCLRMADLSTMITTLENVELNDLIPESSQAALNKLRWDIVEFLCKVRPYEA